jgi:SNF2 family DNA or RNA helicase
MSEFNNIPLATQPQNVKKQLFNHQLSSIYQMETLEREKVVYYEHGIKETRLGFNADITGYGKTLSMIGLVARDKMDWDLDIPFVKEIVTTESGGLVVTRRIERYDKLPTTLVLVPTSIVSQWAKELECTTLTVKIIESRRDVETVEVEKYDIIIVTLAMFNHLAVSYSRYAWKRFIFDEPGHIRVSGMKEIQAGFYWMVTATPEDINSNHRNCRGSFMKKIIGDDFYKIEEQFAGMIFRNDLAFVQASFNTLTTHHVYHRCFQPVLKAVIGLVNTTIQTMIAAGNIEGAIIALGGKKTENILELVRKELLDELKETKEYIVLNEQNEKKVESAIEKQQHIEKQLKELENRFKEMLQDICSICTGSLRNPIMEPSCHNLFCGECLLKWLQQKQSCPLCRNNINGTELVYFTNKDKNKQCCIDNSTKEKHCTPLEKVIDILTMKKNDKIIIFSEYDETFEPICRMLKEKNIIFSTVSGNRKLREQSIEEFKSGSSNVMFLNSKFNCAGINLQEATDIILYHEMSESTQNQIIGRAKRIGRKKDLTVHHLTVEI